MMQKPTNERGEARVVRWRVSSSSPTSISSSFSSSHFLPCSALTAAALAVFVVAGAYISGHCLLSVKRRNALLLTLLMVCHL